MIDASSTPIDNPPAPPESPRPSGRRHWWPVLVVVLTVIAGVVSVWLFAERGESPDDALPATPGQDPVLAPSPTAPPVPPTLSVATTPLSTAPAAVEGFPAAADVGAPLLTPGPHALVAPPDAVRIEPGDDLAAAISDAPPGATFVLGAGVHRGQYDLRPKNGQRFLGEEGAVLNGARLLDDWSASGATWVTGGQPTEPVEPVGHCMEIAPGPCGYAQDLYMADRPVPRAESRDDVGPGTWFYDYTAGEIIVGDDPTGQTVEVAEPSRHALISDVGVGGQDVEVRNLVIEKYGTPGQECAISAQDSGGGWQAVEDPENGATGGWVIADNEIRLHHACGVFAGPGTIVTDNFVHDNGQIGVKVTGRGARLERNEIARNNYNHFDPAWEAGGGKIWNAADVRFAENLSHDNIGSGIWADYALDGIVYERNTITDNWGTGIAHEMTLSGRAVDNLLVGNDWAHIGDPGYTAGAIFIYNGSNFEVVGNVMLGNNGGVIVLAQDRGCIGANVAQMAGACPPGAVKASVEGVRVHGNVIEMTAGFTGVQVLGQTDYPPYAEVDAAWASKAFDGQTVQFEGNRYLGDGYDTATGSTPDQYDNPDNRFVWAFPTGWSSDPSSIWSWTDRRYFGWDDWQQVAGQDQSGRLG